MKNSKFGILLMIAATLIFAQQAGAADAFHGISFLKSATSPVTVGQPYQSAFIIWNNIDTAPDTLHVTSLVDTVLASGGNVVSGNILFTLTWTLTGGAQFVGTDLVLPPGGKAQSNPYSFYTTVVGDFFLPNHTLVDTAELIWHDTCDGGSSNCNSQNRNTNTVSQATMSAPLPSVKVTKTADCDVVTVGKLVTYKIDVQNTGPNPLTLVSIIDTLLGDITAQAGSCKTLAVGASCSFNVTRTILQGDNSPLTNSVTVTYVDEFAQQTTSTDDATVTIIHPDYTVVKTCTSKPIPEGGPATFNVAIHNSGDVALQFVTNEAAQSNVSEPFTVAVGQTQNLTITIPSNNVDVNNTITVTANVVQTLKCPIPNIVKSSNAVCFAKPSIDVTKTVDCNVSMPGSVVTYHITITNKGADTLNLVSVIDSLLGNLTPLVATKGCSVLAGGQSCTVDVNRVVLVTDPSPLVNTVTVNYIDSQQQPATDNASVSIKIIHPSFTVVKTCNVDPIPADSNVATFNVAIQNTGDVNLIFATNEAGQSSLAEPFIVAPGITQNLTITLPFTGSDVPNTITVTGNLAEQLCLEIPNIEKTSGATCHAPPPQGKATRTPGFWQTHTAFTKCVFDKCGSHFDLGWVQINNYADLFGIFWASSAKNTNGLNRDPLCKARELASFQALAALLNGCMENGKPLPVSPTDIATILGGTNIPAIQKLQSQLGAYNTSGDTVPIVDGCPQGNATPKDSKAIANLAAADCGSVSSTTSTRR
jgi:uncharacterized repeat protein (TIGR01451 family)